MDENEKYMQVALEQAKIGYKKGEVPIGACVVIGDKIVAKAHNLREKKQNALMHAEIIAINKACKKLKSWRLDNAKIYVTCEPCPMCAGAMLNARIKEVVFGASEKESGFAGSIFNVFDKHILNHEAKITKGVLESECSGLLTTFFKEKRKKK